MNNKEQICITCEEPFIWKRGKPGYRNSCWKCGTEEDKGTPRLGGVLHFEHKTAPTLMIMSLSDAQNFKKKTDRTGGQGICRGMAERKS